MGEQTVICPKCKAKIELTKVIADQLRTNIRQELEAESRKREKALKEKEQSLKQKEAELKRLKEDMDEEVENKLKEQTEQLKAELRKKAIAEVGEKMKALAEEAADSKKKLADAQKAEVEFLKQKRLLEEKTAEFELEMARTMDAEREKIKADAVAKFAEEHQISDKQKDILIEGLRKTIDELKKKSEQGSNVRQGEALELSLEEMLKKTFPGDHITAVDKGKKGADVTQIVHDDYGHESGCILWESKNTRAWSDKWVSKLKDDRREAKADVAVLMTIAMPKGVANFGALDGVWVTDYGSAMGIAQILRMSLIEIGNAKLSNVGKNEKMEAMYQYLTGPEFKQRVQAIIEPFLNMKRDLELEKAAMQKIWSKREKEMDTVINNASGMYGDLEGIGLAVPELRGVELKQLTSGNKEK